MLTELRDWVHLGLGLLVGFAVAWGCYIQWLDDLTAKVRGLEEFIDTNAPKWGVDR